jgi:hypothetical protein
MGKRGALRQRILGGFSIAALALCGAYVQSAWADMVVVYPVSGTISTSGGSITFPQFNPALGQLQFGDAAVDTLGEVTGTATFFIPGCPGCPIHNMGAILIDYSNAVSPVPGSTEAVAVGGDTDETVTVPWALDLPTGVFVLIFPGPPYVGTGTWSANFPLSISTSEVLGDLTNFAVTPSISYTANVFYDYTPVPEPRLIFPTALLLLGTITVRFRGWQQR